MEDTQYNETTGSESVINEAALAALENDAQAEEPANEDPDVFELLIAKNEQTIEELKAVTAENEELKAKLLTNEEMLAQVAEMRALIEQLNAGSAQATPGQSTGGQGVFGPTKAKIAGSTKPTNRTYTLISTTYNKSGKVPQQQADIAEIFVKRFDLNVPYTETQVNEIFTEEAANYPSLAESCQSVLRLVRYYVDLHKKQGGASGNHANLCYRGLLKA